NLTGGAEPPVLDFYSKWCRGCDGIRAIFAWMYNTHPLKAHCLIAGSLFLSRVPTSLENGGGRDADNCQVAVCHRGGVAGLRKGPLVQQKRPAAQAGNRAHIVADEQDRPAMGRDVTHFPYAFRLEGGVADSEDLIDQQYFWFQVCRHREG